MFSPIKSVVESEKVSRTEWAAVKWWISKKQQQTKQNKTVCSVDQSLLDSNSFCSRKVPFTMQTISIHQWHSVT